MIINGNKKKIFMMLNKIGMNAGIVWRILDTHQSLSYDTIKKRCNLSDRDLNAAIGWLARENKIEIEYDEKLQTEMYHHPHYNQYF